MQSNTGIMAVLTSVDVYFLNLKPESQLKSISLHMNLAEVEFLSENQSVEIIPNFSHDRFVLYL